MAVTATLRTYLDLLQTLSPDLGSTEYKYQQAWDVSLTDGSGANQANKIIEDTFSLAGSASITYDLDAGTVTGPFGAAVAALSRIVAIFIIRTDAGDEDLSLGGDFVLTKLLGGVSDDPVVIPIRPGGVFSYIAPGATGVAVTASTGDALTLTNDSSSDTVTGRIVIIGS